IPNPKSQTDPGSRIPDPGSPISDPQSPISDPNAVLSTDGWLQTGDIGERDAQGRLYIKGRKKEMIVTPEGLNVFPEDVERTLNELPGVRESAVVGVTSDGEERVHAVLVLDPGADQYTILRDANLRLQDHQRIRGASIWRTPELPRTEATRNLKRSAIRDWVLAGGQPLAAAGGDTLDAL